MYTMDVDCGRMDCLVVPSITYRLRMEGLHGTVWQCFSENFMVECGRFQDVDCKEIVCEQYFGWTVDLSEDLGLGTIYC